jgi:hypothetical protein
MNFQILNVFRRSEPMKKSLIATENAIRRLYPKLSLCMITIPDPSDHRRPMSVLCYANSSDPNFDWLRFEEKIVATLEPKKVPQLALFFKELPAIADPNKLRRTVGKMVKALMKQKMDLFLYVNDGYRDAKDTTDNSARQNPAIEEVQAEVEHAEPRTI